MTDWDDPIDVARAHVALLRATANQIEKIANEPDAGSAVWAVRLGASIWSAQANITRLKRDITRIARQQRVAAQQSDGD